MHHAARNDSVNLLKLLIEKGASITCTNQIGQTPVVKCRMRRGGGEHAAETNAQVRQPITIGGLDQCTINVYFLYYVQILKR